MRGPVIAVGYAPRASRWRRRLVAAKPRSLDGWARLVWLVPWVAVGGCGPRPVEQTPAHAPSGWTEAPARAASGRTVQRGKATYYGETFRGRKTASGAPFDPDALTAAHRTLPFGTRVEVRRLDTGAHVVVTITDRGPFGGRGRVVDLSLAAARRLDMLRAGVVEVELRVVAGRSDP